MDGVDYNHHVQLVYIIAQRKMVARLKRYFTEKPGSYIEEERA